MSAGRRRKHLLRFTLTAAASMSSTAMLRPYSAAQNPFKG
jgi:hypothetical protein